MVDFIIVCKQMYKNKIKMNDGYSFAEVIIVFVILTFCFAGVSNVLLSSNHVNIYRSIHSNWANSNIYTLIKAVALEKQYTLSTDIQGECELLGNSKAYIEYTSYYETVNGKQRRIADLNCTDIEYSKTVGLNKTHGYMELYLKLKQIDLSNDDCQRSTVSRTLCCPYSFIVRESVSDNGNLVLDIEIKFNTAQYKSEGKTVAASHNLSFYKPINSTLKNNDKSYYSNGYYIPRFDGLDFIVNNRITINN